MSHPVAADPPAAVALCIHSTGLGPFMWGKLRSAVPKSIAFLAPSNLGYPPHPFMERGTPFTIEDDIAHLLRAVPPEAEAVHLVSHSYGGLVALTLAQRLGARVKSLWLFEPTCFGAVARVRHTLDPVTDADVAHFVDDPRFVGDDAWGGSEPWLAKFVDYWNAPGAWAGLSESSRAFQGRLGWKMYREAAQVMGSQAFEAYRVDAPLTLVHGGKSPPAITPMIEGLASVNPQAIVETFPELPHMAPLTQPGAVAPSLAGHFARVLGGTA